MWGKWTASISLVIIRWQISGFCHLLEEHPDGRFVPVEYKQGKQGKWSNDQAQLCAQALCLEEMTGTAIERGAIFYFGSRVWELDPIQSL